MVSPLSLSRKKLVSFYGSKIELISPAKINLYLNIAGKYSDGFHRIESVVERISLCDRITLKVKKDPSIKLFSNYQNLETDQNLCVKAVKMLRNKFDIPFGLDIFLKKNIPVGSGLGGGSSNAASVLLGMNRFLDLNLEIDQMYQMGRKLGSDVNFFLSDSKFAFLQAKGDRITPLNIKNKFSYFIIWPGIHLSTKEVYKHTKAKLTKFFNNVKILKYALNKGNVFLLKKSVFNALEKSAFSVCKELKEINAYLNRRGIFSKLTGSGSAFYAFTDNISMRKLKRIASGSWSVFPVRTF